jgi:hypothetical protein
MKITIEGTNYEINIEKAKQLGLCTEIRQPIKGFQVGDVFSLNEEGSSLRVLIVQSTYGGKKKPTYNIAGINGVYLYSDFRDRAVSQTEILKFLNERNFKFLKNINNEIASLVDE